MLRRTKRLGPKVLRSVEKLRPRLDRKPDSPHFCDSIPMACPTPCPSVPVEGHHLRTVAAVRGARVPRRHHITDDPATSATARGPGGCRSGLAPAHSTRRGPCTGRARTAANGRPLPQLPAASVRALVSLWPGSVGLSAGRGRPRCRRTDQGLALINPQAARPQTLCPHARVSVGQKRAMRTGGLGSVRLSAEVYPYGRGRRETGTMNSRPTGWYGQMLTAI